MTYNISTGYLMQVFHKSIKQTVLINAFLQKVNWLQSPLLPLDVTRLT